MLGIIGAMADEVKQIKEQLTDVQVETRAAMDFYKGRLGGKEVVVVQSGIGKVNAAICAQILADIYKVSAVVNTGIAGSLKAEIDIGDIVISEDALQHDVDAAAFGYEPGQIPQLDTFSFKADKRLIELAEECCSRVNPDIHTFLGRVVTGDQFVSQKEKKEWLTKTFGGSCTEMEGGAIAQACYLNNVPFLILRAISDKADDSASMDYPAFEAKAIQHSVNLMIEMIQNYEA